MGLARLVVMALTSIHLSLMEGGEYCVQATARSTS